MSILRKTATAAVMALALTAAVSMPAQADEPAAAQVAIDESVFEIKEGQDAQYYEAAEEKLREEMNKFVESKPDRDAQMKYFALANATLGKIFKCESELEEGIDDNAKLRAIIMYGRSLASAGEIEALKNLLDKENAKAEPNESIVAALSQFVLTARLSKAGAAKDAKALQEIADEILENVLADPNENNANTFLQTSRLIGLYDAKIGEELIKTAEEKFAASDNDILKRVAELLGAKKRFAELVGNEMRVEGLFLDGTEIKWEEYRGKTVLIDFWATWCGPCVGEIPNVKAMYEKYHEAGFDVVGYSLDQDLEALEKFEEEKQLPWKTMSNVMSKAAKDKDFVDLAQYYGVESIPTMILVGKDGKVLSTNARGQALVELLEKEYPEVK